MKRNHWVIQGMVVMLLVLLAGCITPKTRRILGMAALKSGEETGFINKTMVVNKKPRPYVVYVPRNYDPKKKWPCILFLHGAGERGDDGLLQTTQGLGNAIRAHADWFPCIVVMPQCPKGVWWDKAVKDITMALELTRRQYSIDDDRIYLSGLSMGGFATWMYGAARVDEFAALLPICGGGRIEDAPALARIPIWAFHGDADSVVPVEESRKMVKAVKAAGGKIKYTEYPGVDHNSWDKTYNDHKVIRWLLRQRRHSR